VPPSGTGEKIVQQPSSLLSKQQQQIFLNLSISSSQFLFRFQHFYSAPLYNFCVLLTDCKPPDAAINTSHAYIQFICYCKLSDPYCLSRNFYDIEQNAKKAFERRAPR